MMKRLFVLITIIASILFEAGLCPLHATTWTLPDNQYGGISSPADAANNIFSSGTLHVTSQTSVLVSFANANCSTSVKVGNWNIPGGTYFYPNCPGRPYPPFESRSCYHAVGHAYMQIDKGDYGISISSNSKAKFPGPASAAWWTGSSSWGFPQVSQIGNKHPYADGKYTIERRACCLCCILSWAQYFYQCPWDIDTMNQKMKENNGYNVRDVRFGVALDLANLELIARFSANSPQACLSSIQKYESMGYGILWRGKHYHSKTKSWFQHWKNQPPGVTVNANGSYDFPIGDPANRYDKFSTEKDREDTIVIVAPKAWDWYGTGGDNKGCVPANWRSDYWWKNKNWRSIPRWIDKSTISMAAYWDETDPWPYKSTPAELCSASLPSLASFGASNSPYTTLSNSPWGVETATQMVALDTTPAENNTTPGLIQTERITLTATSSANVFISQVDTPNLVLSKANPSNASGSATLINELANDEDSHDDTVLDDDAPWPTENPTDDHSSALIACAPAGSYCYHLAGTPGAPYELILEITGKGDPEVKTFTGVLDSKGEASVSYVLVSPSTALQLGAIRTLPIGSQIQMDMRVTDIAPREGFFVQSQDRSSGALVKWSGTMPAIDSKASITGVLVSLSPELIIEASDVTLPSLFAANVSTSPIGMATTKWPTFANCLLAKLWGKVKSVDGTTVVIDNGSGPLTLTECDTVNVGDMITVNAVLRDDRKLHVVPGSCTVQLPELNYSK